jgi:DNA repair protein RadA/Sms
VVPTDELEAIVPDAPPLPALTFALDGAPPVSVPVPLDQVVASIVPHDPTGLAPLDDVTDGGIARSGFYVLAGTPGAGKSTLLLQAIAGSRLRTLYATGEETVGQVSARAHRVGAVTPAIAVVSETQLEVIFAHARAISAQLVVIDSIQTTATAAAQGSAGSQGQLVACARAIMRYTKTETTSVIAVGHVNNDDAIAGPRTLSHFADVTLLFEPSSADPNGDLRILRCMDRKNRFGHGNRVGRLLMTGRGLVPAPIPDVDDADDVADDPELS